MKLPELSEGASPEFTDAATCKAWLEHVPLANVAAAQGELLSQLEEFNQFPTTAAQRLARAAPDLRRRGEARRRGGRGKGLPEPRYPGHLAAHRLCARRADGSL